jgi:O-antigen ligase
LSEVHFSDNCDSRYIRRRNMLTHPHCQLPFGDKMKAKTLPERLLIGRQIAAVATAFMIPVSTSGQAIALSIFVLFVALTEKREEWLVTFATPAAAIPAGLFLLILIGMSWSPTPFAPGGGVAHYAKLLVIPIAMASSFTPRQALQIGYGFLAGCLVVLVLSFLSFFILLPPPFRHAMDGVPLKDNAVQSGGFALCAFALALGGVSAWVGGNRRRAAAMIILALVFVADIFMIFISKTGVLMTAALIGLFVVHVEGWRRSLLIAAPIALVVAIALWSSVPAQRRLAEIATDIHAVDGDKGSSEATLSTASRLDFWSKAVEFIKEAPLFGHGTGSTKSLYQSLEATRPSPYGEAVPDPHNQFFAIAIQVGLVGGVILLAMWTVHFSIFIGRGFASAIGQAIVIQNFIGSLFNSHLSTVTQGMLYCLAVGLLGGIVQRARRRKLNAESPSSKLKSNPQNE